MENKNLERYANVPGWKIELDVSIGECPVDYIVDIPFYIMTKADGKGIILSANGDFIIKENINSRHNVLEIRPSPFPKSRQESIYFCHMIAYYGDYNKAYKALTEEKH